MAPAAAWAGPPAARPRAACAETAAESEQLTVASITQATARRSSDLGSP